MSAVTNNWLNKIAELHEDWLRMVNSFGKCQYSEDIVQEMYLKLERLNCEEKVINEGKVNKTYIWYVLKNLYIDYHKQRSKVDKVRIGNNFEIETEVEEAGYEEAFDEFTYRVNKEIKSWCIFDQKLFKVYTGTNMSMRDIAEQTDISLSTIFNTIKNCKERLKAAVGEDYIDICNGDYDKI